MTAAVYNITVEQGATFTLNLVYKDNNATPINLTGYTARMQIRRNYNAVTPLATFTTENGRITLGTTNGAVAVTGEAALTASLTGRVAVYDLELIAPSGVVTRLIRGSVTIIPEVTK